MVYELADAANAVILERAGGGPSWSISFSPITGIVLTDN
jgi:hypothetical protein